MFIFNLLFILVKMILLLYFFSFFRWIVAFLQNHFIPVLIKTVFNVNLIKVLSFNR